MIIHLLIMILATPQLLFTMNANFPCEIIIKIASQLDMKKICEIVETQSIRNQLQNDSDPKLEQVSAYEIQQAIFPCLSLIKTCSQYYALKREISTLTTINLREIFPYQEVPLFLFPKSVQTAVSKEINRQKEAKLINSLFQLCAHNQLITFDSAFMSLFFTPPIVNDFVKTNKFSAFLKEHHITCKYNAAQRERTLYNNSNNDVIALFVEEKHQFNCPFTTATYAKAYKKTILNLMLTLLCNHEIEGINGIFYVQSQGIFKSYTIIEGIFVCLKSSIKTCNEKLQATNRGHLTMDGIIYFFANYFKIINFLCSLPTVDLSLPATQANKNIAETILEEFKQCEFPLTLLLPEALEKLKTIAKNSSNPKSAQRKEKEDFIITTLVNTYLRYVPKK